MFLLSGKEMQIKCERCGQVTVIGRKKEIIENV